MGSPAAATVSARLFIDAIAGFQVAVAEAAHNPLQRQLEHFLIDLLLHLQIKVMRERGVSSWQEQAATLQPDRRAIVEAIEERNSAAAQEAMSRYLQHQRTTFVADRELAVLHLADPRAVAIASELRHHSDLRRTRRPA